MAMVELNSLESRGKYWSPGRSCAVYTYQQGCPTVQRKVIKSGVYSGLVLIML